MDMPPIQVICLLILLAQSVFVGSQAFYIAIAYVGKPNFRHITAMGISYSILTILSCFLIMGWKPFNLGAFTVAFISFIIGNTGLWMIREKARETRYTNGHKPEHKE